MRRILLCRAALIPGVIVPVVRAAGAKAGTVPDSAVLSAAEAFG
jgi:hypothetical protein